MGVTNSNKVADTAAICCGDQFKMTLALTAAPDIVTNPTDIVLALDCSGSMSGAPLADMKLGAKTFIDIISESTGGSGSGEIGSGSRIGIVSFEATATVVSPLETSVADLKSAINGLTAGGGTNHGDAFAKAQGLFENTSSNARVIVMFTDGVTTSGPAPGPIAAAARAAGIPIFERAQAWGHLMRSYKNAICVAGTHGKTTTTSMLTHIFMQAQRDPTVMIGGSLPLLGAGHRVGRGDTIILESCEYCNSFLNFFPTAAVILDVDADHLDFFKDLADVEHSFRAFAALVPAGGLIVANGDDANTADALRGMDYVRFGFAETNDVCGKNFSADFREFDVYCGGALYCHPHLGVLGRHNAMNALAACAVAWKFGISGADVEAALAVFHGAGRGWSSRGRITAQTSMTIMHTIRTSCTPYWRRRGRWAISA